ncbi:MAG TPA: hypothetical protein DIT54_02380 [Lachnospiraceae bacterium]|nr:hypothetical protein [Lachnospiraceae bacterium]
MIGRLLFSSLNNKHICLKIFVFIKKRDDIFNKVFSVILLELVELLFYKKTKKKKVVREKNTK